MCVLLRMLQLIVTFVDIVSVLHTIVMGSVTTVDAIDIITGVDMVTQVFIITIVNTVMAVTSWRSNCYCGGHYQFQTSLLWCTMLLLQTLLLLQTPLLLLHPTLCVATGVDTASAAQAVDKH